MTVYLKGQGLDRFGRIGGARLFAQRTWRPAYPAEFAVIDCHKREPHRSHAAAAKKAEWRAGADCVFCLRSKDCWRGGCQNLDVFTASRIYADFQKSHNIS